MNGITRIVAGYHASPASLTALGTAKDLAERMNAEIHVVHAIDLSDYPIDPDRADWEEQAHERPASQRENIDAVMSNFWGRWFVHIHRGDAFAVLCQIANQCDAAMIVIGARTGGLARVERFATLSVVGKLLNHPGRPVLVVPSKPEAHS
jgi:nucleotide-binding universal stress UspA family protein